MNKGFCIVGVAFMALAAPIGCGPGTGGVSGEQTSTSGGQGGSTGQGGSSTGQGGSSGQQSSSTGQGGSSGQQSSSTGQGSSSTGAGGGPSDGLRIGIWLSPWELGKRTPQQFVNGIRGLSQASSYPNRAVIVFSMCGAATETNTLCLFDKPAGVPDYPNVDYGGDQVTPIMDAIEADGNIDVILDVEPMSSHVSDLMHVVMTKYGAYKSVVGFSPDWEWAKGDGDKVSKLAGWTAELQGYKAGMEFHLISWVHDAFGSSLDDTMSFGCDSQGFPDLSGQLAGFGDWTTNFAPHRTGVYWGYDTDAAWTKPLCTTVDDLRALQDKYRDVNPKGMILMATESLYFERDAMFSISP